MSEASVLLKLPITMIVPADVAMKVFELLSPHLGATCKVGYDGEIKYVQSGVELSIGALTNAALAEAALSE